MKFDKKWLIFTKNFNTNLIITKFYYFLLIRYNKILYCPAVMENFFISRISLSCRKRNGETRIFDETFSDTNSEVTDITILEDRMKNLPYTAPDEQLRNRSRHHSHHSSQTSRISIDSSASEQQQLPAFIRSTKSHPHTRSLRKCDPVSR